MNYITVRRLNDGFKKYIFEILCMYNCTYGTAFFAAALELFSVQRQCSKHLNQADPHLRQALSHHCWVPHPRQQCHHCHCPAGHCPLGDSMTLIKPRYRFSETPPLPHLSPCSGFPTQHKLCYNKQKYENFIILFA